tara:strand:+ start:7063 stop:7185 length:123 start_codon:yes stop_codon:yes gene_type:complete
VAKETPIEARTYTTNVTNDLGIINKLNARSILTGIQPKRK